MEGKSRASSPEDSGTLAVQSGVGGDVRVRFLEHYGRFYVIPSAEGSEWAIRAIHEGGCRVIPPNGVGVTCAARYLVDPVVRETIRAGFRRKYGGDLWARHFAGPAKLIELDPGRAPSVPSAADLLEMEFDAAAPSYDDAVAQHAIERYLKNRVAAWLVDSLREVDPLLEIGPGTGFHTLPLLADGHRIVALDSSAQMLAQLRGRAEGLARDGRLTMHQGRLGDMAATLAAYPDGAFGAAFSAFGAFNIDPELDAVGPALSRLIRPGGRLIFTSLNRPGLTPLVWELALGRPRAAGARLRARVPAGRIRYPLDLNLWNPFDWDRILGPGFRRLSLCAVSALAPPFDSRRIEQFLGSVGATRMKRWDGRISSAAGSWRLAEWVGFTYERVGDPVPPPPNFMGTVPLTQPWPIAGSPSGGP